MSNRLVGKVLSLFISEKGNSKRIKQEYLKVNDKGIIGDKFYAKDTERSVLLTTKESYILALNHNIRMEEGSLGENILIDFNPYSLGMGTQIQMGDVVFEITQYCTICTSLSEIDKTLPTLLKKDRGIFIKVLKSGLIKVEDLVYLIE